jgi:hypothetical protein
MTPGKVTAATAVALFTLVAAGANAADVEITCEKRAGRSRASVDGSNLNQGSYRAVLKSGDRTARSPFQAAIGDEAEFDFDSNQNDIAEGATAIPANFIVDGRVRGFLVNDNNVRVTPVVRAICRVRR